MCIRDRPGADYGPAAVAMARQAGFDAAVSTSWGAASAGSDLFQLPRFTPWHHTRLRFGAQLFMNLQRTATPSAPRLQPT